MKQVKKVTKNLNKDIQSVTKDIQSKAKEGIEKINTELKDLKSGFERRGKIINFLIFFIVIVFAVFGHYLYTHQAVIEEFSPAFKLHHVTVGSKFRGKVKPNYPVLIIPGIVSTGLELWDGDPCAMKYFRQRMWGTMTMLNVFLRDPSCWKKHMMLDLNTGLDPKNVKLRPANGLEAADYLFPGYWVWGKVIENLGEIGYDPNSIQLESYDWRLSFANLEKRDSYFTKLKSHVELLKSTNEGKKVAMLTHSMGSLVGMYFLKWTEHNCNPGWVDEHIESFVNIGGPMLGVSKSLSTLLSGEMKDTSQFLALQSYLVDNIISPDERLYLARSWSSISSMLPKGGDKIWGNLKSAKDDIVNNYTDGSYGKFLSLYSNNEWKNLTAEESVNLLFDLLKGSSKSDDKAIAKNYNDWYSYGISTPETGFHNISEHEFEYNNTKRKFIKQEQKYWSNPLESPLPFAPNMKVYCLYGVGKDTERGYIYKTNTNYSLSIPYGLQTLYSRINEKVVSGVRLGAGDGTVPIMSLGYMCVKGWKNNFYNPSNMKVYTREYNHLPSNSFLHLRGGPGTSDHVDIMGNSELMTDVINIITGNNESDEDKITDINKEFWDNIKD